MSDPKIDATPLVDTYDASAKPSPPTPESANPLVPVSGNATANASKKANAIKLNGSTTTTSVAANSTAAAQAQRPRLLKTGQSTPNMNGPLYMQTSGSNIILVRRLKRKEESTWKHLARWFVENQIGTF